MFGLIRNALGALREAAVAFDDQAVTGDQAAALVELCTEVERIAQACRTLAARRVQESKIWQRDGHRTAAHWVAAKTGTSVGQAVVLETAQRLDELPAVKDAFRTGGLSEVQAREISEAAWMDPRSERALIETARARSVGALREECRRVRAAAVPDELAAYEAIRRRRYLRHWSDADGAVRLDARLTPDAGAVVIAAIGERRDQIFAQARRAGLRESSEAYAADALVELASRSDGERASGPRAMVHVLVDHKALSAGRVGPGERCEIPGVGRIPAATARALAADSILKVLVTKGSDVQAVAHNGRTIPARVRTALEVRDPECVVPDCDARKGLEIDHYRIGFAEGGPTQLDNLARLCRWHHYTKTHLGFRLRGEPGAWTWETPADLEETTPDARPPPDP